MIDILAVVGTLAVAGIPVVVGTHVENVPSSANAGLLVSWWC